MSMTIEEFILSGKATSIERLFLDKWFAYASPGTPEPLCQYRYVPGRKFTADFAWECGDVVVLVECDGGVFSGKAHGSISGIVSDIERANHAAANRCLRFRCHTGTKASLGALRNQKSAMEFVEMVARAVMSNL